MLSVYAFRDFAEALNTADEQEKLKAKQAEQQAAEAEAKARARPNAPQPIRSRRRPLLRPSIRRAVPAKANRFLRPKRQTPGRPASPAPAQVPATTDDPNKVQVKIPVQVPVQ